MARFQIWLFGSPQLILDGHAVTLARRKDWALLAYLLMERRPQTRESLATLFWPTFDQNHALANLRRTLSRLHRQLAGLLRIDRAHVAIDAQAECWIDVEQFTKSLDAVQRHPHDSDTACAFCLKQLVAAHTLYTDDFLAGFTLRDSPAFDDWHFFQQEALRDALRDVLARLVNQHIAHADLHAAIACTRDLLNVDPLHEASHRRLMWLYLHTGQRSAALRQFRTCTRILQTELQTTPDQATVALYQEIIAHAAPRADAGGSPPIGDATHRMTPDQVPAWPFVGRTRQLAQLHAHLDAVVQGSGKIVFVTGEVGAGKTALLHNFARQASARHPTLIIAAGVASAFGGADLPFLPFRDLLEGLASANVAPWLDATAPQQVARQSALLPHLIHALLTRGPHLVTQLTLDVDTISQTSNAKVTSAALAELRSLAAANRRAQSNPAPSQLLDEYAAILHALASQCPMLLLLDDWHWADAASLHLLFHLGKHLESNPLLLVCAYRPSEIMRNQERATSAEGCRDYHPLLNVTHEFVHDFGEVVIDLDAVTAKEAQAWQDALLSAADIRLGADRATALFAQTRGHPLFTIDLLGLWQSRGWLHRDNRGGWNEGDAPDWGVMPTRTLAAIQLRMDHLRDAELDLLTIASVEGETFSAEALACVQHCSLRTVLDLLYHELHQRHRLVVEVDDSETSQGPARYRFAHPLVRRVLYEQIDHGERRLLQVALANAQHTLNNPA